MFISKVPKIAEPLFNQSGFLFGVNRFLLRDCGNGFGWETKSDVGQIGMVETFGQDPAVHFAGRRLAHEGQDGRG